MDGGGRRDDVQCHDHDNDIVIVSRSSPIDAPADIGGQVYMRAQLTDVEAGERMYSTAAAAGH